MSTQRFDLQAIPWIFRFTMSWPTDVVVEPHLEPGGPSSPAWLRALFDSTDDGSGGRLQTARRWIKFRWRCWWHALELERSAAAFRDSRLDALLEQHPNLQLRPLRSYLRRGLSPQCRAQALESHFRWLSNHLPMTSIERLYRGEALDVLSVPAVPGLSVCLASAQGLGREGELALHLQWQGQRVMSVAFSVIDAQLVLKGSQRQPSLAGARAVVGAIQGVRGADEALRELSVAAQRLRPSALLVLALQGLSAGWGLQAPLCVNARSHVYQGYASRTRKVRLDYDAAGRDAGGEPLGSHYWLLPAEPRLRPDAEVESRRRAQHRRRNTLRTQVFQSAAAGAADLLHG